MQNFNLHTHTWRCGHATGSDEEYIQYAMKAGFKYIGFSEHLQYRADRGKYNRINHEEFIKYFKDFKVLKEKYQKEIQIICGLEAAYVPEAMSDLMDLIEECDYVLLGQHQGGLRDRKYGLRCSDAELLCYTQEIEQGLETGLYTILAHPDFFMNARGEWNSICKECSYRICNKAKALHIPLELNIKGSYELNGSQIIQGYPNRKFWEIAATVGNDVIYGWDAHAPEQLLRNTEKVDGIVKELNLFMVEDFERLKLPVLSSNLL